MMSESTYILDLGGISKYGALSLHIEDHDLDPFAYRLLGHYRTVIAEQRVPVAVESNAETAQACKMSVDNVRDARQQLFNLGYILLDQCNGKKIGVALVDKMPEAVSRATPLDFPTPVNFDTPLNFDRGNGLTPPKNDRGGNFDRGGLGTRTCEAGAGAGVLGAGACAEESYTIQEQESWVPLPTFVDHLNPVSDQQPTFRIPDREYEERGSDRGSSESADGSISEEAGFSADGSEDRIAAAESAGPPDDPTPATANTPSPTTTDDADADVSQRHASAPKPAGRKRQPAAKREVGQKPPKPPKPPPYRDSRCFVEAKYYVVDPVQKLIFTKPYSQRDLGERVSDASGVEAPRQALMERKGFDIVRGSVINRTPEYATYAEHKPITTAAERIPLIDAFGESAFDLGAGFNYETINGNFQRIGLLIDGLAADLGKTRAQIQSSPKIADKVRKVYAKAARAAKDARQTFYPPRLWEKFQPLWEKYAPTLHDEEDLTKPRWATANGGYWEYYNTNTKQWEKQDDEQRRQERENWQRQRFNLTGGAKQRTD